MKPEFAEAFDLRARAIGLDHSWEVVSPHHVDQDPGLRIRLGARWREIARLFSAAADKIDPRPVLNADEIMDLFR